MSELRQTPIYRALHRPNLVLGGDRKLMMIVLIVSAGLIVTSMNLYSITVGIVIGIGGVYGLRRASKADPLWFQVYRAQRKYKHHYAPYSRPSRALKEQGHY